MKKILITMLFLASAKLFAQNISVQINPGEQWNKRVPQCAIWLEDENNNYIDTIFVTNRASKKTGFLLQKTAGQNLYLYGMVNQMVILILEYQKNLMQ